MSFRSKSSIAFQFGKRHCHHYFNRLKSLVLLSQDSADPHITNELLAELDPLIPQITAAQEFARDHYHLEPAMVAWVRFFSELAHVRDSVFQETKLKTIGERWALDALKACRATDDLQGELTALLSLLSSFWGQANYDEEFARASFLVDTIGDASHKTRLAIFHAGRLFEEGRVEEARKALAKADNGKETPDIAKMQAALMLADGCPLTEVLDKSIEAVNGFIEQEAMDSAIAELLFQARLYLSAGRPDCANNLYNAILPYKDRYETVKFKFSREIADLLLQLDHPDKIYFLIQAIEYCRVYNLHEEEQRYSEIALKLVEDESV